jgi:hypothetical protein
VVGDLPELAGASLGEHRNRAWPWILLTHLTLYGLVMAVLVGAVLVTEPRTSPRNLASLLLVVAAPTLSFVILYTWSLSFRAPLVLVISNSGITGVIRYSPLKRFEPREVRIPFDQLRGVTFFLPYWSIRSKQHIGGVSFLFVSRENAAKVLHAWRGWQTVRAAGPAGVS